MSVGGRSNRVSIGAVYKDWIQLDGVSEVSTVVSIIHHAVALQCATYVILMYLYISIRMYVWYECILWTLV